MEVIKGGIDTIEVEFIGNYKEELKEMRVVLDDKTTYTDDNNTRVVIRPNNELSELSQALECVKWVAEKLECKEWRIVRVDMSTDFRDKFEDNLNLSRLLLGCLAIVKKIRIEDVFNTKKGIEEQGNLKIKTKRLEITIYNCNDKNRIANMRIEFKSKDIRNGFEDKEKIENEIKGILEDLKGLDKLVEKVEEVYIERLAYLHHNTIGKKYRTFSEFVAFADSQGYIMTSDILKGLMAKAGLKIGYKKFVENFRKTRTETLNFVTKNELKKFIKDIEKNLKLTLKN
ncbi:MAG: hypothetical protein ACRC3I_01950 [Cetobacterium sp.]